jgi:hypothetical protein
MAARGPFAQRKRVHYLAALLLTASVSTSGTSHFAQPRHLRKDSEVDAMARRRRIDVVETFRSFCAELRDFVAATSYVAGNRALVGDYRALLEPVDGGGSTALRFRPEAASDLVYMDPPYTADHYSRFYHVLEVLAAYDYPPLARGADGRVVRGRYPVIERRFQSPFCVRRSVEAEFDRVIRGAAATGAKLVISYGYPSGLLFKVYAGQRPRRDPIARLEALCLASYAAVKTLRRPFLHSGQGDKNLSVEELLVVCSRPRGGSAARVASSTGMATRA